MFRNCFNRTGLSQCRQGAQLLGAADLCVSFFPASGGTRHSSAQTFQRHAAVREAEGVRQQSEHCQVKHCQFTCSQWPNFFQVPWLWSWEMKEKLAVQFLLKEELLMFRLSQLLSLLGEGKIQNSALPKKPAQLFPANFHRCCCWTTFYVFKQ